MFRFGDGRFSYTRSRNLLMYHHVANLEYMAVNDQVRRLPVLFTLKVDSFACTVL